MYNQYSMSKGTQGSAKKWRGKKGSSQCVVCSQDLKNNNLVIEVDYKRYAHEGCIFSPVGVAHGPAEPGVRLR